MCVWRYFSRISTATCSTRKPFKGSNITSATKPYRLDFLASHFTTKAVQLRSKVYGLRWQRSTLVNRDNWLE